MPLLRGVGVIGCSPLMRLVQWRRPPCYDDGMSAPQATEVLPGRPGRTPITRLATIFRVTVSLDKLGIPQQLALPIAIVFIGLVALAVWLLFRFGTGRVAGSILARRTSDSGDPLAVLTQVELERRVRTLERLVIRSVGVAIGVVAVLMALGELGLDTGPAIASLGVVGIAVGFGAQSLIKDWLAGIFVVLENQYNDGDVVRIAGVSGVVEDFSLRRTTLRDLDGTVHTVPNGQIVVASNLTRTWARVNLDIPVVHGTDIDAATTAINEVGAQLVDDPEWGPRLLEAPRVVRVNALDDLGITLKVLGQVRAAEQWSVAGELRKRILAAFAGRGIRMPTTQRIVVGGPDAAVPPPDSDRASGGQ